jgi:hypothetical protein
MTLTDQQLSDLKTLWQSVLGTPPEDAQFIVWTEMHSYDVVRRGITKTAQKNLQLHGTMQALYKIKFASSVMRNRTAELKAVEPIQELQVKEIQQH